MRKPVYRLKFCKSSTSVLKFHNVVLYGRWTFTSVAPSSFGSTTSSGRCAQLRVRSRRLQPSIRTACEIVLRVLQFAVNVDDGTFNSWAIQVLSLCWLMPTPFHLTVYVDVTGCTAVFVGIIIRLHFAGACARTSCSVSSANKIYTSVTLCPPLAMAVSCL